MLMPSQLAKMHNSYLVYKLKGQLDQPKREIRYRDHHARVKESRLKTIDLLNEQML